jgi:hypothetical protein
MSREYLQHSQEWNHATFKVSSRVNHNASGGRPEA